MSDHVFASHPGLQAHEHAALVLFAAIKGANPSLNDGALFKTCMRIAVQNLSLQDMSPKEVNDALNKWGPHAC